MTNNSVSLPFLHSSLAANPSDHAPHTKQIVCCPQHRCRQLPRNMSSFDNWSTSHGWTPHVRYSCLSLESGLSSFSWQQAHYLRNCASVYLLLYSPALDLACVWYGQVLKPSGLLGGILPWQIVLCWTLTLRSISCRDHWLWQYIIPPVHYLVSVPFHTILRIPPQHQFTTHLICSLRALFFSFLFFSSVTRARICKHLTDAHPIAPHGILSIFRRYMTFSPYCTVLLVAHIFQIRAPRYCYCCISHLISLMLNSRVIRVDRRVTESCAFSISANELVEVRRAGNASHACLLPFPKFIPVIKSNDYSWDGNDPNSYASDSKQLLERKESIANL